MADADMGPAAQARLTNRIWRLRNSAWLLSPILGIGMGTGISFLYLGTQAKRRDWQLVGVAYAVAGIFSLGAVFLLPIVWIVGIVHATSVNPAWLRYRAHQGAEPRQEATGPPSVRQGWNGPTPPPAPVHLAGMDLSTEQFYAAPGPQVRPPAGGRPPADRFAPPAPDVPRRSPGATSGRNPHADRQDVMVDVNSASAADLATLPGMSPTRCEAILVARDQGRLRFVEDFGHIAGLASHELIRIRDRLAFRNVAPKSTGTEPQVRVVD